MVTVDDLLEEQEEAFNLLEKFIDSHHKTAENKITQGYMQARLKLLDEYFVEFRKVHKTLRNSTKPEQRAQMDYFKKNKFETFIDVHVNIQTELNDLLIKLQRPPPVEAIQQQPGNLKLPRVQIPQFSGNYQNWTNFYDVFLSLVHNHPTLSKVEKLHHLKSALTGEAEQLLRHFTITEVNYEPAWELLKKRYKNDRLIINAHLKTLTSIRKLNHESPSGLRSLLDTTTEALLSLKNLGVPTDHWGAIVVFLTEQKMDAESFKSWEQSRADPGTTPTVEELNKFLETRFKALEMVSPYSQHTKSQQRNVSTFLTSSESCRVCHASHRVYKCNKFFNMDRGSRRKFVDDHALCANCLSQNHQSDTCKSRYTCRFCHRRHHSMLHDKDKQNQSSSQPRPPITHSQYDKQVGNTPEASTASQSVALHHIHSEVNVSNVLLATAMVQINSPTGTHTFRALVDPCSQASFISEEAVKQLKLPTTASLTSVNGVGTQTSQQSSRVVGFFIKPCQGPRRNHCVTALVLPVITQCLPKRMVPPEAWAHLHHLPLADPSFAQPGQIDLLLGAKVFKSIILPGLHKGRLDGLIAQQTTLGWIITGDDSTYNKSDGPQGHSSMQSFHSCIDIDQNLQRFWELENIPDTHQETDEDRRCEEFYKQTVRRSSDGRYIVKLPFSTSKGMINKQEVETCSLILGRSRYAALSRLYQVEKRFTKDPELGKQYSEVMSSYLSLGHMEPVEDSEEDFRSSASGIYASYYLAHHAVIKESSSTTRIRAVFDGSMKTSEGTSLNDHLLVGPTIQQDLMSIILRWRKHKIAFTADIEQMYRQVRMDNQDSDYQRVLWRTSSADPVKEYRLLTVTFGISSAPFLAIRTLHQLAYDESQRFPKASNIALKDFYVDDLMSGCDTVDEAKEIQTQLINMLKAGGFALKKWSSNSAEVIHNVPEGYRDVKCQLNINTDDSVKTLGIRWQPASDVFNFKVNLSDTTEIPTKRRLLSDVAKLFDPLGWLAPTVILAKIMFQSLWLLGLTWDEPLPPDMATRWIKYRHDLPALETIQIPRHIGFHSKETSIQLHGFSDASLGAYSAVVYSRILHEDNSVTVRMVTSKTRVAPVKSISVPRLELCGAVLLARLLKTVMKSLSMDDVQSIAWTDSTVVLAWLHKPPSHWKVFVGNRTTEILEITSSNQWRHVSSTDNPADCATRGVSPADLKNHPLWWTGPRWLQDSPDKWPSRTDAAAFSTDIDLRKQSVALCLTNVVSTSLWDNLSKFSTKSKIIRTLGYCLRFIRNAQEKDKTKRIAHHLQPGELQASLQIILLLVQSSVFYDDIKHLKDKKELGRQSKLLSLNPFLDEAGILRVGGRLQKSNLPFNAKHPVILPPKHEFTKMLIQEAHIHTLHGGTQLTLSYLRRKFWILNARNTTRFTIHQCIRCHRFSGQTQQQIMGNLPASRVTPSRPFSHTGVDYAGPVNVRVSKGRGTKTYKGYLAIFVCLATTSS